MYTANAQKQCTKHYTALIPVIVVNYIHATIAHDATLRLEDYPGRILYENGTAEDAANLPTRSTGASGSKTEAFF